MLLNRQSKSQPTPIAHGSRLLPNKTTSAQTTAMPRLNPPSYQPNPFPGLTRVPSPVHAQEAPRRASHPSITITTPSGFSREILSEKVLELEPVVCSTAKFVEEHPPRQGRPRKLEFEKHGWKMVVLGTAAVLFLLGVFAVSKWLACL